MNKTRVSLLIIAASLAVVAGTLGLSMPITGGADETGKTETAEESKPLMEIKMHMEMGDSALPGTVIEAHPYISNEGQNGAFVFVEMRIPVLEKVEVEEMDGLVTTDALLYSINPSWSLIEETEGDGIVTRAYCYGSEEHPTPLEPDEVSTELFSTMTMVNLRVRNDVCGEWSYSDLMKHFNDFNCTAYAIQTKGMEKNTATRLLEMAR